MPTVRDPCRFLVIALAGWMSQRQLQMIEYLREENRVLRGPAHGELPKLASGVQCALYRLEPDARGDALLNEAMILLDEVVQIRTSRHWHRPTPEADRCYLLLWVVKTTWC